MAGYDYTYRDYSTGKGTGPHINEWNKTSYANDDECRTVIVDADGTQWIIVGCSPFHKPGSYVGKTETIIRERVHSPGIPSYKHSTPTKIEPAVKDYRFADDKWYRPSSPVKGYVYGADDKWRRPSSPVKGYVYAADDKLRRPSSPVHDYPQEVGDFLTKVQTEASRDQPTETIIHESTHSPVFPSYKHSSPTKVVQPVKDYRYADDKWHRPSSPPKGYGYAADDHHKLHRPSSPVHDYPREVQTQASCDQPPRIGLFNGVNWRQPPQKTGHNGTTGYGDYSDYSNKTLYKPRNDDYDDYNSKKDTDKGPNMISNRDRAIPNPSTWAARPVHDGRLSSATDDIETALRFLKESAKPSSVINATPRAPYSALPKQGEYPMEAGKRHVRFK